MNLFKMSAIKRTIIIYITFQALLWLVFGISYLFHEDAWQNVEVVDSITAAEGGWLTTFLFILFNNLIICLLVIVGNIFVRFGFFTPGMLVLLIQAIMIGWMAGSNGFEIPFTSVYDANIEYLKVGLWETTAYALVCGVTITKSLYISDSFPAKKWVETKTLKDLRFTITEKSILFIAFISLLTAAIIETIRIMG